MNEKQNHDTEPSEKSNKNNLATLKSNPEKKLPPVGVQWIGISDETNNTSSAEKRQVADPPGRKTAFVYRSASQQHPSREKKEYSTPITKKERKEARSALIKLKFALPGSNPSLRVQAHEKAIKFEFHRRSDISLQLQVMLDQWDAVCGILRYAIDSIAVAERLVSGFAKAGNNFASNLCATSDDKFVNDRGDIIAGSFAQKRLYQRREKLNAQDAGITMGQCTILDAIVLCQYELAGQAKAFLTNSQHLADNVLPLLHGLRAQIETAKREIEPYGERVFEDIKRSEVEVKSAWETFTALSSLEKSPASRKLRIVQQTGGLDDGWLFARSYEIVVAYQQAVLQDADAKLKKLRLKIALIEETRLDRLRTILTDDFIQYQTKLFESLPNRDSRVLGLLETVGTDANTVEKFLQDRSRIRLKYSKSHRSSIMNRSRSNPNLSTSSFEENAFEEILNELGDPFTMVLLSKTVELKTGLGDFITAWKQTIAAVTKDEYIHFFEVPSHQKREGWDQCVTDTFQMLSPNTSFDSPEAWTNARKEEIVQNLRPFLSLNLKKCSADIAQINNKMVEVTEEGRPQPRNSFLFGSPTSKDLKCTLRFQSIADASKWVGALGMLRFQSADDASNWVGAMEKSKKKLGPKSTSQPENDSEMIGETDVLSA